VVHPARPLAPVLALGFLPVPHPALLAGAGEGGQRTAAVKWTFCSWRPQGGAKGGARQCQGEGAVQLVDTGHGGGDHSPSDPSGRVPVFA
jgi:hypothetical protein